MSVFTKSVFTKSVFTKYLIRFVAVGMSSFHIYTAYFGTFYPYTQRSFPVMLQSTTIYINIKKIRSQKVVLTAMKRRKQ